MLSRLLPTALQSNRQVIRLVQLVLLFLMLVLAVWLVTQQREAPQLILLLLLYIITVNFSVPPEQGAVSLVPVVSVTSFLLLGLETAVLLGASSLFLAELARPLWNVLWENIAVRRPSLLERLGTYGVYLAALAAGGFVYQQLAGQVPPVMTNNNDLSSFGALALVYTVAYFVLSALLWVLWKRPLRTFLAQNAFSILSTALLAQPFALFGGVIFTLGGLPIFVVFSLSVMFVSVILWLSWQRRYVVEQRLAQLAALNEVEASLRETLDLPAVLQRTYAKMAELVPADAYTLALVDEDGRWWQPPAIGDKSSAAKPIEPDDFMCWVAENGRVLDLNPENMHFAARHDLAPPSPRPTAWLGAPLRTPERTIGVLVLQRYPPNRAFSRWSREVLLALAGQAGSAIQNARLHSETVRLYNLTDEALARRLRQLQALLDTMQEGVVMVDTNGRIVLVNTFAARLLGLPADALRSQQLEPETAAAPLGYQTDELADLLALLHAGQAPEGLRLTYQLQDGGHDGSQSRRFMERSEAPVVADSQQVLGWLMLFRDVTEEYELAEQRTDLTRMIVHDLRNPVTTFISNMNLVQMLLPPEDEAAAEAVEDARQSGYDMLDMVDSLMDVNRMEAGQLVAEVEAVNLRPLVEKVVARLGLLAEMRHIRLTCSVATDVPPVWADEDMIRRVLVNLMDNALKFTPGEGAVHCEVVVETAVSPHHDAGARCIISDTGPGIPAEDRDKIFDRFMRTNRGGAQVRGTGLGLTFCRLAVEAHNGRIWVEADPGGGSRFIFTLPGVPRPDA